MADRWRVVALVAVLWTLTGFALAQETPEHRIGVRVVDGVGEFYNRETGERFVPRGFNYIYLIPAPAGRLEDQAFAVGVYERERVERDFRMMSEHGYNTVRMFLDTCSRGSHCIGRQNGRGLNPDFLDNIAEVMQLAKDNGLYLLLTSNDLPEQGGYWAISDQGVSEYFAGYRNHHYLTEPGVRSAQTYWRDLLEGLAERDAPFDAVLGWSLLNEQWYFNDQPPFSLHSGSVTAANGQTYNLADPEQQRRMASEGIIHYMAEVREVILEVDPTALVTMGFFVPDYPNSLRPGDFRYVDTAPLLANAPLDFFDFHAYPGVDANLPEIAENYGMIGYEEKPILMGEMGAFVFAYASPQSAAPALQRWMAESCEYGFDGWLYWGYYSVPLQPTTPDDTVWGAVDEGRTIFQALAPVNQPDPCTPTELPNTNVAYGKTVTASQALPQEPASQAVDGLENQWGAGAHPPQWIEVDLEQPYTIGGVRLQVAQYPAGETLHRVWARRPDGLTILVYEFAEHTEEFEFLEYTLPVPLNGVQFVRVETLESPSWVAWREIEVISAAETGTSACIATGLSNANLRAEPDTNAEVRGALAAGQGAYIDGQMTGTDGFVWWRLPFGAWVRSDVVNASEGCDTVPAV